MAEVPSPPGADSIHDPDPVPPVIAMRLTGSTKLVSTINDLSTKLGVPEGDVILAAIGLLHAAMDAKAEGLSIGAASDRDHLDVEFVGF